jgi:tRNA 2-thiocytidine biosynthesis protein TtcA
MAKALTVNRESAEPDAIQHRVLDLMGRAMGQFQMLQPGDRIAVGVSGGKDSLCLLHALVAYRRRAPFPYDLVAVTIEQGKFKAPIRGLEAPIRALGVEWVVREDPATLDLVAGGVLHGCDVCSRHRRSARYRAARALGCTALALGHTADDCAEALLRNILFNGRIASLPPVARSRKGGMRLIRPLVYAGEALTESYARAFGLAPVGCVCGDKDGVRREIRGFLSALAARHPGVPESLSAALGNVNPRALFDAALQQTSPPPRAADAAAD